MKQANLKKALDITKERDMVQTALAYLQSGALAVVLGTKQEFTVQLTPSFKGKLVEMLRIELQQRDQDLAQALRALGIEDA